MSSSFSTLVDLKDNIKQHNTDLIVEWILRYRKFATVAAMQHKPNIATIKDQTLRQYFDQGAHYLRYGSSDNRILSKKTIALLDQRRNVVQAYQPSTQDVRRECPQRATTKQAAPPVTALKVVQSPVTTKFQYGIFVDKNTLRLFDSKIACQSFNDGVVFAGGSRSDIYMVEANKEE